MSLISVSEHFKFHVDTKNLKKLWQKSYGCFDNLIWVGNGKLSLLPPVNVLSSRPKISDLIENNFFWVNLAQNDNKVG